MGLAYTSGEYKVISGVLLEMLKSMAGTADLERADLAAAAEKYLLSGGMTAQQIQRLKANLGTKP